LIVLAKPMLMVLFMRGAFSLNDVDMASYSLMAYGCGLLNFMLIKVLAPGYYSRHDTKTPVRYGIIAMVSNIGLNLIFAVPFGYVGLAIATSISALLNAGLLYRGLHLQDIYRISHETRVFIIKITVATLIMALGLWYFSPDETYWLNWHTGERLIGLTVLIFAGALSYLLCLLLMGIRPWKLKRSS
jgi:putative peptidoglycan lipid II flippase